MTESIPPVADTYDGPRPDFVRSVPVAGDLSGSTEVILTNLAFAGISLMLLLLSAEIFNQTVEENDEEIKRMARKYAGPVVGILGAVGTFWSSVFGGKGVMSALVGVLAVVGVAAFIFSLEEDGVGLNEQTLVMFVSLVAALLILTYWYDGGQILIAKNFGVASVIRLFPVGILIAVVSLAVTRFVGFHPGLIYGFIAAAVVVGPAGLSRDQEGHVIFWPALSLMVLALVSWLLLDPLRDMSEDSDSWIAALPEGIAVGIFVGAVEGMFLQLIPMRYMDGYKIWSWNKLAWLALAGLAAFLFWHALLNSERSSWDALDEATPATAIGLMAICFGLTLAVWAYFRFKPQPVEADAA